MIVLSSKIFWISSRCGQLDTLNNTKVRFTVCVRVLHSYEGTKVRKYFESTFVLSKVRKYKLLYTYTHVRVGPTRRASLVDMNAIYRFV